MVSLSRILTKLLLPDERAGTLIFFLVSAGLELLCFLLHLLVRGSRFVLYHTARPRHCRPSRRAGYRVHHDVAAEDVHFVSREVGGGHLGAPGTAATLSQPRSPSRCRLKLQLLLVARGAFSRAILPHVDHGSIPRWHACPGPESPLGMTAPESFTHTHPPRRL